jgi:hypothetical protein
VAVPGATPENHPSHHLHGADSWPGNWHLVVSESDSEEEEEEKEEEEEEEEEEAREELADSLAAVQLGSGAGEAAAAPVVAQPPAPGRGNVICVAHDGGAMGTALVRWALRTLCRPTDRAMMVVHVTPSTPARGLYTC